MESNTRQSCGLFTRKRIALVAVLFFFGILLSLGGWFLEFAGRAAPGDPGETKVVVVPPGSSVTAINRILAQAGLVRNDIRFPVLARYLGVAARLQAGEFALHRGQTPLELLKELASAKPIQHAVTIPEGLTVAEIAAVFADGGWCDAEEFVRLANDPEFIESVGLGPHKSLEGYLFPETYYLIRKEQTAADLLRMQVRHFFTVWNDIKTTAPLELSPHEVLILASMVEKEAAQASERPLIAGVFFNRLKKGMRMQSDPTVIYGIKDFSGTLTRTDLQTPSPYNTYTLKRLPVGPICNPGKESLRAVLHPAESSFLYFVSNNDGSHIFSKNLREHNRAVNKYQRSEKEAK